MVVPAVLLLHLVESDALDARCRPGEVLVDHRLLETDGLEDLRPVVGLDGGDAHLGHGLQDTLAQGLDQVGAGLFSGHVREQAVAAHPLHRLQRQVRVDGLGAVADEQAAVHHLPGLARLHHDGGAGAQPFADQVVVHRRGRQQAGNLDPVRPGVPVGQDQHGGAPFLDGPAGFLAQGVHGLRQRPRGRGLREHRRQRLRLEPGLVQGLDARQLAIGEHRPHELELAAMLRRLREQILLRAHGGPQRGHQLFTDGVEGRIGHLREELLEVVEKQLGPVGKDRERCVVAHGAHRLFSPRRHGADEDLELLAGVAEGALAFRQGFHVEPGHVFRFGQVFQRNHLLGKPLAVRPPRADLVLDLVVVDDAPFQRIDEEEPPRLQPATHQDALGLHVKHARLGRAHDEVILGDHVAEGPQPVPVQSGAHPVAVAGGDERRTVPRLHEAGVIGVERLLLVRHGVVVFPGLGDHHHQRVRQRPAGGHQQLQRVVESRGVACPLADDRAQLGHVVAEERRREQRLPRPHPVLVAPDRVDLAVVAQHPVGVRQPPRAQRVGAVPRVDQCQGGDDGVVREVTVEGIQLVGPQQALVDHGLAGQAGDVEVVPDLGGETRVHRVLDDLADDVELSLELVLGCRLRAGADEELPDEGRHLSRHLAALGKIRGHVAPAQELLTLVPDGLFDHLLAPLVVIRLPRQEDHADAVAARIRQGDTHGTAMPPEKGVGNLEQDAGAVAGMGVASAGAAMLEVDQDVNGVADDVVGLPAVEVGHDAHAARVVLMSRVVESLILLLHVEQPMTRWPASRLVDIRNKPKYHKTVRVSVAITFLLRRRHTAAGR